MNIPATLRKTSIAWANDAQANSDCLASLHHDFYDGIARAARRYGAAKWSLSTAALSQISFSVEKIVGSTITRP